MILNILSIAGSDPSGGAGIQNDLKAMSANGSFAMASIAALTVQNTQGVSGIHLVPAAFVQAQIKAELDDICLYAVKIKMIANVEIAAAVAEALQGCEARILLNRVMITKGGAPLLQPDAVDTLHAQNVLLLHVLTPNSPETTHLLGAPIAQTREEMTEQARALIALGPNAILMKDGHLYDADNPDCLVISDDVAWFEGARTPTLNTHGTGCTLSAALAAQIAHKHPLPRAIAMAKAYVSDAIAHADELSVGSGHGPTHNFVNHKGLSQ